MSHEVESFKLKNGNVLKIYADNETGFNPRKDYDNMSKMYCFHRNYALGDDHNINTDNYTSLEAIIEENTSPGDIVVDLYLYDHGNLAISTSPFGCRWDSGKIGFAVVDVETIKHEYGDDSSESREKALLCLIAEVKTYHYYLSGQCYGYILEDSDGDEVDSCWGFLGDYEESGLFDEAGFKREDVA